MRKIPVYILVLAGGCFLSVMTFLLIRNWEYRVLRAELEKVAVVRLELLRTEVRRSLDVLHSISSFYASAPEISRSEFSDFVRGARNRQPEIQALEWVPEVKAADRAAFEAAIQAEGYASFSIKEYDGEALVSAGFRERYFPVCFIEPMIGNEPAFGYDTASNPKRLLALERARESGVPVATAPVRLAQETENQQGFLVFHPLHSGGSSRHFNGFAVVVFRIGSLLEASLRPLVSQGVIVSVFDEEAEDALIYDQMPPGKPAGAMGVASGIKYASVLDVAARRWRVEFSLGELFITKNLGYQSWIVLGTGLLFSGLVATHLVTVSRQAEEIKRHVLEKTAELSLEITERKLAEDRLRGARDTLEARVRDRTLELAESNQALLAEIEVRKRAEALAASANAAKSQFLANMSHEIRTPMNVIMGYSQILERDASLHPFQKDAVKTITGSCHHLLALVDDILDLSKIEAGKMDLNPTEFDLFTLVREITAMFQQPCEEKLLGFKVNWCGFEFEKRFSVKGDEQKLRQVLINLVGNAVKFTEAGNVTLSILSEGADRFHFEVKDTGIGISPDVLAQIFEPFYQEGRTGNRGGTGLGLTIARRLVELMGGELMARSDAGSGSKFFFSLGLPVTEMAEMPHRMALFSKGEKVVRQLAKGYQVTALVVDDIRENRDVLTEMLEVVGCRVLTAEDAPSALESIGKTRPDIVFMDMRLPGMSGLEAVQEIIKRFGAETMRIVSMSASVMEHEQEAYLKAGCDDFVAKPVHTGRLYQCLETLLDVKFDYEETETSSESGNQKPVNLAQVAIPEDLALRMMMAAELHSTTVLKNCLSELRERGVAEARLAEHLKGFMASYDMDTIQKLLTQVPVLPTSAPPQHGLASDNLKSLLY